MSSFDLVPDLASRLDRLVPAEALAGDWTDVARRARPRRRPRLVLRLAIAAAAVLALAAVATATYLALSGSEAPQPGALTVISSGASGAGKIVEVLPGGKTRLIWRCPHNVFCGDLVSVDWSPDGRHVAFTLDEIGGTSAYIGLHIVDISSGRDLHLPHLALAHPMAPQPFSIFPRLLRASDRQLGCRWPGDVAWTPDGKRLGYDCQVGATRRGSIFTIGADGKGFRRIPIGVLVAGGPTWSPDGKRLAFSGVAAGGSSAIYIARADGSNRILIARNGWAPDWAPDGKTIAYETKTGVRLVTPDGTDVTPGGASIRLGGRPAWSPDSQTLAVGTKHGVYLVDKTGQNIRRATTAGVGSIGLVRPAWYPAKSVPRDPAAAPDCGQC
jgi:dipeptidyl aminopeptidase/acylaminoacyl peptidase